MKLPGESEGGGNRKRLKIAAAALAIGAFYIGWILLALSLLGSRHYSRTSAALVLAGIALGLGLSGVTALGRWHGAASSLTISAGWFVIGLQMLRAKADLDCDTQQPSMA